MGKRMRPRSRRPTEVSSPVGLQQDKIELVSIDLQDKPTWYKENVYTQGTTLLLEKVQKDLVKLLLIWRKKLFKIFKMKRMKRMKRECVQKRLDGTLIHLHLDRALIQLHLDRALIQLHLDRVLIQLLQALRSGRKTTTN